MGRYRYPEAEAALLESSVVPFAVFQYVDERVVTLIVSDGLVSLFGYTNKEAVYRLMDDNMYRNAHPDDVARIADHAVRFATKGGAYDVVYRLLIGGKYHVIHSVGRHVYPEKDVQLAYVWYTDEGVYAADDDRRIDDALPRIFSASLREADVHRKVNYDFLTGLPNMTYFYDLARESRDRVLKSGGHCCICFVDFNGMKHYNKKHGFVEGDKLLQGFAKLVRDHFGSENACRIAQDNFAIFSVTDHLEEKLQTLFDEVETLSGDKHITVRVGIYADHMGAVDTSLACDRAHHACNSIRNINQSGYRYFDASMLAQENNRQFILDNLDRALEERWIQAYYQPIIRAANDLVCDEEALARWIDPELGMLSPGDFIPILEDSKQIYRVDLYIVDRILERMKEQEKEGVYVVPISVNLSRTDFDSCDIVEEICRRVDDAGIDRGMLTIEITESTVGRDYDFMKKQVERFKRLGFHVWMDDFGSGYSSLDLLQTMKFDLIKLDMRFMKQFDNSDNSRVIVTELMKMAVGLGIETVAEGVERADQVEFLREVGCTKLQGFYYSKPVPYEEIRKRYQNEVQIGFENPEETAYYESLGRINLYDMALASSEDPGDFGQYFNTFPMAIIETDQREFKIVRGNRSYREFLERYAARMQVGVPMRFEGTDTGQDPRMIRAIRQSAATGEQVFIDERIRRDLSVHAFVRRIAVNPVTGVAACMLVIPGVNRESEQTITFADIAHSLSTDYAYVFYVELESGKFIDYRFDPVTGNLTEVNRGEDFFNDLRRGAHQYLHPDDVERFRNSFDKETVIRAMDAHGAYTVTYRRMIDGKPLYAHMKAMRMSRDATHMIVGVSDINAQMIQQQALQRMQEERITYARISALAGNYICIYTVDPETGRYTVFEAKKEYEELSLDKAGDDFFAASYRDMRRVVVPEDQILFEREFTRENVLNCIRENGVFLLEHRLLIGDRPTQVRLKATLVEEKDGPQLIVGVSIADPRSRRKQKG